MHISNPVHLTIRWLMTCALCCLAVFGAGLSAHPIQYHLKPLESETVERVLRSMGQMAVLLESHGTSAADGLPDGAMGVSVLSWALPDEVAAIDLGN